MNFVSFVLIFKGKETYFVFHIFVLLFTKLFQLIQECKTSLISHFFSLGVSYGINHGVGRGVRHWVSQEVGNAVSQGVGHEVGHCCRIHIHT